MDNREKYFQQLRQLIITHVDDPNRSGCLRALQNNKRRILEAPGSRCKHQAYPGGWLKHHVDSMQLAIGIYPQLGAIMSVPLDFSLGDVILCLLWHDWEKPFKYVKPIRRFKTSLEKRRFIFAEAEKYRIMLSPLHQNIIRYIHGEGKDYNPSQKVQLPAAALAHAVDTLSARVDTSQSLPKMKE